MEFLVQTLFPSKGFCYDIGNRTAQNRNSNEACSNNADSKEQIRQIPGQGLKRQGCLFNSIYLVYAAFEQNRPCCKNNKNITKPETVIPKSTS